MQPRRYSKGGRLLPVPGAPASSNANPIQSSKLRVPTQGPRYSSTPVAPRVPLVPRPEFITPIVTRPAPGQKSYLPRPFIPKPPQVPSATYVVDPEPGLGQSFHEHLERKPPIAKGTRLIKEARPVAAKLEAKLQPAHSDPWVRNVKRDEAAKVVQNLAHQKNAEKKAALESIKRRQEEARAKHSMARDRAAKITKAKQHLKSLGQGMNIDDVLALIREENKDIEEAASGGGVSAAVATAGSGPKQLHARRNASLLRRAVVTAAPASPIASVQRALLTELAEQIPASQEEAFLEPEAVVKVMLAPEIVEPPLNTSLDVAEEELYIHQNKDISAAIPEEPERDDAIEKTDEELMRGYVTLFGGEREMSLYMREAADRVKAWLENVTLHDSMLLEESDVGEPEQFVRGLEEQVAAARRYRTALASPPVTRVQLRGTQPPAWFPGYYTVLPQSSPPRFQLARSPSTCLAAAWRACRPEGYSDDETVLIR